MADFTTAMEDELLNRYVTNTTAGLLTTGACTLQLMISTPDEAGTRTTDLSHAAATPSWGAIADDGNGRKVSTNADLTIEVTGSHTDVTVTGFYLINGTQEVFFHVFSSAITNVSTGDSIKFASGDLSVKVD